MSSPRLYCKLLQNETGIREKVFLPEALNRHCLQVLRMGVGDALVLFDGTGLEAIGEIVDIRQHQALVAIQQHSQPLRESNLHTHLYQSLLQPKKMALVLQKAVELGVNAITPVMSARCQGNAVARAFEVKRAHFEQVVISACEQSGRVVLPTLMSAVSFEDAIDQTQGWLLDPSSNHSIAGLPTATPDKAVFLIGPEGGLTADEIQVAADAGWQSLRIGPRVLRTETASSAMLSVLQARWGDWQ